MLNYSQLIERINNMSKPVIVAVDGRAASGKTTLANRLSEELNAQVIHMDDFFLPLELRSKKRFNEPGGNVHYERFIQEVLPGLKKNEPFEYGVFDCSVMKINSSKKIEPSDVLIVEGAYSLHPLFNNYADFKIFVSVDKEKQLERIAKRNGKELLNRFVNEWIPLEETYIETFNIQKLCDIILECEGLL